MEMKLNSNDEKTGLKLNSAGCYANGRRGVNFLILVGLGVNGGKWIHWIRLGSGL